MDCLHNLFLYFSVFNDLVKLNHEEEKPLLFQYILMVVKVRNDSLFYKIMNIIIPDLYYKIKSIYFSMSVHCYVLHKYIGCM